MLVRTICSACNGNYWVTAHAKCMECLNVMVTIEKVDTTYEDSLESWENTEDFFYPGC